MSIEQSIRDFVDRFYAALNGAGSNTSGPLLELWAQGPEATLLARGGAREMGWEEVRSALFRPAGGAPLAPREVSVRLLTTEVAVVSALESGAGASSPPVRCTLVVRRDAGAWRLVHRHQDAAPQCPS